MLNDSGYNEELIRQAVKNIEAEPEGFDMRAWVQKRGWVSIVDLRDATDATYDQFKQAGEDAMWNMVQTVVTDTCGTVMCLAGHIVHAAGMTLQQNAVVVETQKTVCSTALELVTGDSRGLNSQSDSMDVLFAMTGIGTVDELKREITFYTGINFD